MVRKRDGSKEKAVKHILVLSLDVFAKLRAANVLLRHSLPKNVCVCIYHANINFLIGSLHHQFNKFQPNHKELILLTTCNPELTPQNNIKIFPGAWSKQDQGAAVQGLHYEQGAETLV